MKCKKHPSYKAIRRPTADCAMCKHIYNLAQKRKMRMNMESMWEIRKKLLKKRQTNKTLKEKKKSVQFQTEMGKEAYKEMLENAEMLDRKHLDYGSGNIARFGLRGIVVRMNDKIERLATLTDDGKTKQAQFESIEDTLRDLSNYATIGLLCMKGKWK